MTELTKSTISIAEFAFKVKSLWNSTYGSEWNSKAAGFVVANVWAEKASEGEIRVYIGEGYVKLTKTSEGAGINFCGLKYGIKDLAVVTLKSICSEYKVAAAGQTPVLIQEDEDGIIAPEGQHEIGVHIVREWVEYR